jgi:predicted secreted protein
MMMKTSLRSAPRTIFKVASAAALAWFAFAAPASAQPAMAPPGGACPPTFATDVASVSVPASRVRLGQIFALSLGLTPGTGYHWTDTDPSAQRPFTVVGQTYRPNNPQPPGQPPLVGGSGEQLWLFRATAVGTGTISLKYVPPGGKPAAGRVDGNGIVDFGLAGC